MSSSSSTSSSVSPKVIVPSVTVITLLVLITLIGAVIIFVRAYKKRRRHAAGTEKQDEEAAVVAAVPHDDENRTGKHRDRRSGASSKSRNSRGFQSADIISPVPRAVHSQQETRDIVEQGFHRSRRSASEGSHDGFEAGYSMWNGGPGQIPQQQQQPDTMTAHIVGKIERIMGNPLSNDFYNDRASGTGHSRNNSKEKKRESKRHSYPLTAAPIRPRPKTLELDTNLSPISPNETELSTTRDFSPYSADITGIFKSLSPPPAAPAAIALRYPNVTALVRANIPAETSKRSSYRSSHRASSRFSYTQLHDETRLGEHISSQYNSAKEKIASPLQAPTSGQELAPLPSPPAWAAFGGFSARTSKSSSSQPSHSSGEKSGFASDAPTPTPSIKSANNSHGHTHRISWNGRSVLDLDGPPPPVPRKRTPPPPPPSASPRPLRRKEHIATPPSSPPKFATAPRIRTSAFGPRSYPAPPPIPPDPQDIAVGSTSMRRSGSIGKMSVLSVPSTISSFNTVGTVSRTMGLSPTPARVTPRNTPEPIVNEKDRRSAISGISGTSEGSSVTVKELQMEMGRIRARARRAEVERRARRREDDDGQQKSWLAEEEPGMDQDLGQRFF